MPTTCFSPDTTRRWIIVLAMVLPTSGSSAYDGFGRNATGGAGGAIVTVTTTADLVTYATASAPYVISVQGTIVLGNNVNVASNKTIQGIDSTSTINGDLLVGNGASNVIVRFLNITNPLLVGDGDGVTIINGATNVVIDHCTFTDCADGSLDVTNGSDSVTVSWCRFRYVNQTVHNNVNLVGSSDTRSADLGTLHVTFHHCWYDKSCIERMPSVRFGRVHVYNNYYGATGNNYCVRTRLYAECRVENNFFENVQNPWEILTTSGTSNGRLFAANNNVSFGDSTSGVTWVAGWYSAPGQTQLLIDGTDSVFVPPYAYVPEDAQDVKHLVLAGAGNINHLVAIPDPILPIPKFELSQNYPNPFNPTTYVRWSVDRRANVVLSVQDLSGRRVALLFSGISAPGWYNSLFDGSLLPSGIYYIRLQAGNSIQVRKAILLK